MNEKQQEKRAQKTKAAVDAQGNDLSAKFTGFVNFEWTDAHKEHYAIWANEFNFWDEYNAQCAKGRRISTQYDLYHQCYVSSCFERDVKSVNAGAICTARGMDAATSISRLLFLVSDVLREGWGLKSTPSQADKW